MKNPASKTKLKDLEAAYSSLQLLYEVGREVSANLDLRTLLHRVLFLAMKNVGAISGSIIVLDENGQPGVSAFLIGDETREETSLQLRVTYERGMAGWVARQRKAVLIEDTSKDDRWLRLPDDAADRTGSKSALSMPILDGSRLVGVMTLVHPQVGFFTQQHLQLAEAIASWAGAAILRAQLVDNLSAAERRYRELFDDSIDPIMLTDWDGRILEINRQAEHILLQDRHSLQGTLISDRLVLDIERLGPNFDLLRPGATIDYESVLHDQAENDIPVQVYVRSIRVSGASHLQWILHDLTERKDLDRLREDLIAMVYHDLRSPLANISSSLEVLLAMLGSQVDENIPALVRIAIRSTDRIQRLTASLLDLSRLEAGQIVGQLQPVQPENLVHDAIETVSISIREHNMALTVDIPNPLPKVMVDSDMIRRVLVNLLENAIKYSRLDGNLTVRAERQSEFVLFSIRDDGPGIPSADQERIFDKFTRLRNKEGPRGLGLGLAYCRLAVINHGGQIWVESEPGIGSDFKFTLPIAHETR